MQTKVKELLERKGRNVWSIGPSHTVYQAVEMMALKGVGALTVLADDGSLVGIISERDYARKVILKGLSSQEALVADVMTPDPLSIHDDLRVDECMGIMTERRIRHLPVIEHERLVGMISVGDLVKCIIDEQSVTIEHLERYIRG